MEPVGLETETEWNRLEPKLEPNGTGWNRNRNRLEPVGIETGTGRNRLGTEHNRLEPKSQSIKIRSVWTRYRSQPRLIELRPSDM